MVISRSPSARATLQLPVALIGALLISLAAPAKALSADSSPLEHNPPLEELQTPQLEEPRLAQQLQHPDPHVRLALARMLAERPELEAPGALANLSLDPDLRVATMALLGLSRSRSPDAIPQLERALAADDPILREFAALALLIRARLAPLEGLESPSREQLERCPTQVVSSSGAHWLQALSHLDMLLDAQQTWSELQTQLLEVESAAEYTECISTIRVNPALLLNEEHLTELYEPRPANYPNTAIVTDRTSLPRLFVSGQHTHLLDMAYEQEDINFQLQNFLLLARQACSLYQTGVASLSNWDSRPPDSQFSSSLDGWAAIGLGMTNHPFAFRPARQRFLMGEDVEMTLTPHLLLAYRRSQEALTNSRWARESSIGDGYGLILNLGGTMSSHFFEDRSRPQASLTALYQSPPLLPSTAGSVWAAELHAEFSDGYGDNPLELSSAPLPHLAGWLQLTGTSYSGQGFGELADSLFGLRVHGLAFTWEDPSAVLLSSNWLQTDLSGDWLSNFGLAGIRLGLMADGSVRSDVSMSDLLSARTDLALLLRWSNRLLHSRLWVGAGSGWADSALGLVPIGGMRVNYKERFGRLLRIDLELLTDRSTGCLGRAAHLAVVDRAHAQIALAYTSQMRDTMRVRLFTERARTHQPEGSIGWGGIEIFIPVALDQLTQEISYRMRYMAVLDSNTFDGRSQEVFEALLVAGTRF